MPDITLLEAGRKALVQRQDHLVLVNLDEPDGFNTIVFRPGDASVVLTQKSVEIDRLGLPPAEFLTNLWEDYR